MWQIYCPNLSGYWLDKEDCSNIKMIVWQNLVNIIEQLTEIVGECYDDRRAEFRHAVNCRVVFFELRPFLFASAPFYLNYTSHVLV